MKKRHKQASVPLKRRTLEEAMANFREQCEKCGEPLDVIKFRQTPEIIGAVCRNKNFKGMNFHCELYQIEIRFRQGKWF